MLYNMNEYNEQGEKHGPWERYYTNGNSRVKANYVNGQPHGLCEYYYLNGKLAEIEYYIR